MTTSFISRLGTSPEEGVKAPCKVASTSNITLSGEQTVASVALVAGDRCLVAAQTDASENGIWSVSAGAWERPTDWNDAQDVVSGVLIPVEDTSIVYQATFTGTFSVDVTEVTVSSVEVTGLIGKLGDNTFQAEYDHRGTYDIIYLADLIGVDLSVLNVGEFVRVTRYNAAASADQQVWELIAASATAPDATTGINTDGYFYTSATAGAAYKFGQVTSTTGLTGKLGTNGLQSIYNAAGMYDIEYLTDLDGVTITLTVGELVRVKAYSASEVIAPAWWKYAASGATAPDAATGINSDGAYYTHAGAGAAFKFTRVSPQGVPTSVDSGGFEGDSGGVPDGWLIDGSTTGTVGMNTTTPGEGGAAVQITVDDTEVAIIKDVDFIPVSEYRRYVFSMIFNATGANTLVRLRVSWYDKSQTIISTTVAYENTGAVASYTRAGGTLTPPSTARYMKRSIYVLGTTDAGRVVNVDDVRHRLIGEEEFYEQDDTPATGSVVPYYDPNDGQMKSLDAGGFNLPAGIVAPYAGSSAPSGWLLCNGAAVNRTTYAALFAVVGTTYGVGDGSSTFNLPNLTGRIPVGADAGGTVLAVNTPAVGDTFGEETHLLTGAESGTSAHVHPSTKPTSTTSGALVEGSSPGYTFNYTDSGASIAADASAAHNNMPPSLALNYIIKT